MDDHKHINTLRVATRVWPGLILYSGMTTNTILSTSQTILDTTNDVVENLKIDEQDKPFIIADRSKSPESTPSASASPEESANAVDGGGLFASVEHPAIALKVVPSVSPTGLQTLPRPKTVPVLSFKEIDTLKTKSSTAYLQRSNPSSNLGSDHNCPRLKTAGQNIIVAPKHSSPTGLDAHEMVRGIKLCTLDAGKHCFPQGDNDKHPDKDNTSSDCKVMALETYGEGSTAVNKVANAFTPRKLLSRANSHMNRKSRYGHEEKQDRLTRSVSSMCSKSYVCFELSIMSINPTERLSDRCAVKKNSVSSESNGNTNKSNRNQRHMTSLICQSDGINTIEQLKQNYRRTNSAPPGSTFSEQLITDNQQPHRKFSNMYWRTRSAYHKQQMDISKNPPATPRDSSDSGQANSQLSGSLLRPLMHNGDDIVMKHSTGCPYKCKGCFKACLVSEDYINEARMNAKKSWKFGTSQGKAWNDSKKAHSIAMLQNALIRNHLKRGYRDTGSSQTRLSVRPWPTYAWVDIQKGKRSSETGVENNDAQQ